MSCVPNSPFISKSVIISSSSFVFIGRLYASCKPAIYIIFAALNLILGCPGLKLAITVHRGCYRLSNVSMPVTKTRPAGATGTS